MHLRVLLLLIAALILTCAEKEDIFTILKIPRDSNPATIQSAYRRAALRLHPDKSSDPNASEKFKALSSAYSAWRSGGDGKETKGNSTPNQRQAPERKKRGVGGYIVWAVIDGVATVSAGELLRDYQGVYFDASSGSCEWVGKSPPCLATTCPPTSDFIRRTQGWSEPRDWFGGRCTSPYGGKPLCCRASAGDKSWGGSWQSSINGQIIHCTYWLDHAKLDNSTDVANPYCGELDCNRGTSRFFATISGAGIKCNEVHFTLNSTDTPWLSVAPVGKSMHIFSRKSRRLLTSNGGHYAMTCDRVVADGWEFWSVADAGGGQINLIQRAGGKTLFASSGRPMYANQESNGESERFTWEWQADGYFSLLCHNNYYAAIGSNGQLYCNGSDSGAEEAQFLFRVGKKGIWAAGVVQFDEDPVYGSTDRIYKIR
jgi:hypothetical protein